MVFFLFFEYIVRLLFGLAQRIREVASGKFFSTNFSEFVHLGPWGCRLKTS